MTDAMKHGPRTHFLDFRTSLWLTCLLILATGMASVAAEYLSPTMVIADREGRTLYVAESTARQLAIVDVATGKPSRALLFSAEPTSLVLAPDGARLYVTTASPQGRLEIIDTKRAKVLDTLPVGHTPSAVAVSPDGAAVYVCNRFDNNVAVIDLATKKQIAVIDVPREPIAAVLTTDGKTLFVANHLPVGPATGDYAGAVISVIDTNSRRVTGTIRLPNGSTSVRSMCLSPDGKFIYVTHILAHYQLPTTQLDRGWMNTNALTILDAAEKTLINTVLLDDVDLGAANPWGVACSPDGKYVCVAHSGTHEISVIDRAALHDRLTKVATGQRVTEVSQTAADVPSDLSFLVGLKRRLKLAGNGPRGLTIVGSKVYAAEYFTDSLGVVDLDPGARPGASSLPLGPARAMTSARRGEMIFYDASRCFQQWQSCQSCHPDGRADALNWDLLNDGIGNPKNTRNMLLVMQTPPSMSLAVRESAAKAVRAGFRFIQFSVPQEEESVAVETYLRSMEPVPSPALVKGALSPAAQRGKAIFMQAGCANCHPSPLYTDLRSYDLGLGTGLDKDKEFDTPTLRECWRTAPYLHDGRAATLREVIVQCNPQDKHGATSKLSPQELADLIEFVRSL